MRIGELAATAGITVKAVRYYERIGLLNPDRLGNGYRHYGADQLRAVLEIKELAAAGIPPSRVGPFIDCLHSGHEHSDDCPSSLATYRDSIAELDATIATLSARRKLLAARLLDGAARISVSAPPPSSLELPTDLPVPADDGAASHLPRQPVPRLSLTATDADVVRLNKLPAGRTVLYIYPLTGHPHHDLPEGWDAIPGARGCTTEACDFRDHFAELLEACAAAVYGLSSQDSVYQREVVERLRLPFTMLSDPTFQLARSLKLPTFTAGGLKLYRRLTLVISGGVIEHVFYPIFPPNEHARQVLDWLRHNPARH